MMITLTNKLYEAIGRLAVLPHTMSKDKQANDQALVGLFMRLEHDASTYAEIHPKSKPTVERLITQLRRSVKVKVSR
jgi:hypothetical protein